MTNPNVFELVDRYREKGLIIDTNLLLVFLVGNVNPGHVGRVGRTGEFCAEDYQRLQDLIMRFPGRLVTLPQILTEASNLLKMNCGSAALLFDLQQQLATFIMASREARVLSRKVAGHAAFHHLGYPDASILKAAAKRFLLLTRDGPLQGLAHSCGVDVLPFNWLET